MYVKTNEGYNLFTFTPNRIRDVVQCSSSWEQVKGIFEQHCECETKLEKKQTLYWGLVGEEPSKTVVLDFEEVYNSVEPFLESFFPVETKSVPTVAPTSYFCL
jgi:hypothetical protein